MGQAIPKFMLGSERGVERLHLGGHDVARGELLRAGAVGVGLDRLGFGDGFGVAGRGRGRGGGGGRGRGRVRVRVRVNQGEGSCGWRRPSAGQELCTCGAAPLWLGLGLGSRLGLG